MHMYVMYACVWKCVCDSHMCRSQRRTLGTLFHYSLLYFLESGSLLDLELGWHPVSPGVILAPSTLTVLGYSHRQPHCAFYECWGFELRSLYFFSKYSCPERCLLSLIWRNFDVTIFHVFLLIEHFTCSMSLHVPFIFNVFCSSPLFPSFSLTPPRVPHHTLFQLQNFFYIFPNPLNPIGTAHLCMCVDPNTEPLEQLLEATSFKDPLSLSLPLEAINWP